jgi:hypothetical protein
VGGCGGEVRGKTPQEAWDKFNQKVRPEIEERFGLFVEAPSDRQAAFKSMRRDPKTQCWVLDYYFTK